MPPAIMIVEDDRDIRFLLAEVLQDEGYAVQTAEHGRAALNALIAAPRPPCLIITDLMMPVMDGWTFCRERTAIPALADVPVVVISAIANLPATMPALGVIAAFSKPLDLRALLTIVTNHCSL